MVHVGRLLVEDEELPAEEVHQEGGEDKGALGHPSGDAEPLDEHRAAKEACEVGKGGDAEEQEHLAKPGVTTRGEDPEDVRDIGQQARGADGNEVIDDAVPVAHVIRDGLSINDHAVSRRDHGVAKRKEDALMEDGGGYTAHGILDELKEGVCLLGVEMGDEGHGEREWREVRKV